VPEGEPPRHEATTRAGGAVSRPVQSLHGSADGRGDGVRRHSDHRWSLRLLPPERDRSLSL